MKKGRIQSIARRLLGKLLGGILLGEALFLAPAQGEFIHRRPTRWLVEPVRAPDGTPIAGGIPDPDSYVEVWRGTNTNVKTTAGIDFLFAQGYSTSPGANGLNYIALSNDSLTENTASTTLSNEIASNGLTRAQGTYAHSNGTSTATVSKTFSVTGTQACQKAALFTASSSGTMNHPLSFTQRSLANGDTLTVTFTLTLT